ncbi:MAG: hypothetical protein LAO03_09470 [Acidobacteriia bacterium]|nr:hypothetical protein [Terriglobia bacterium]
MKSLRHLFFVLVALVMALFTACGSPGIPLPPSLELPKQVTDLRAVRKGDKVYLAWTVPTQTTDLQSIRHLGMTKICRSLGAAITNCANAVGEVPAAPVPAPGAVPKQPGNTPQKARSSYADTLAPDLQQNPAAKATYAVSVFNADGHTAGLSNQVQVPAAPVLSPPPDFKAQVTADGVALSWGAVAEQAQGLRHVIRVYRRLEGTTTDTVASEVPVGASSYLDQGFEWQKSYSYRVTVVTFVSAPGGAELQVEGDDTPVVKVVAADVFPPVVPSGLQAVASGVGQSAFVDLIWAPDAEADLAGYNVYRHEEGEALARVNSELVKAPAYRDTGVTPGKKYFYAVSAVDVRGNESAHSEETSEAVP